jgi:hypothetical protein
MNTNQADQLIDKELLQIEELEGKVAPGVFDFLSNSVPIMQKFVNKGSGTTTIVWCGE